MIESISAAPISPLRQRLIEDMELRHFSIETKRNYIRDVARFATWLGRPPDKATAEDLRRFQVEQREGGMPSPTMNSVVAALRFFFTHTLDRPDLSRRLYRERLERKLPVVLSREEVARLLQATTCLKHHAALAVAYGAGLRVAEVSMLKVRDVDSERMLLRVERGKGGRYRNAMLEHRALNTREPSIIVQKMEHYSSKCGACRNERQGIIFSGDATQRDIPRVGNQLVRGLWPLAKRDPQYRLFQ